MSDINDKVAKAEEVRKGVRGFVARNPQTAIIIAAVVVALIVYIAL